MSVYELYINGKLRDQKNSVTSMLVYVKHYLIYSDENIKRIEIKIKEEKK